MKKVRFESPIKIYTNRMDDLEYHSPRPFIEKQETFRPEIFCGSFKQLTYNPDCVQRFDNSNNFPYPVVNKTALTQSESKRLPSNELNLSFLDNSSQEPRKPFCTNKNVFFNIERPTLDDSLTSNLSDGKTCRNKMPQILASIENNKVVKPNHNSVDYNEFFIRRENFNKIHKDNFLPLSGQFNGLSLGKENAHFTNKSEIMRLNSENLENERSGKPVSTGNLLADDCTCYHCNKVIKNVPCGLSKPLSESIQNPNFGHVSKASQQCQYIPQLNHTCKCNNNIPIEYTPEVCGCNSNKLCSAGNQNAVDKKTWMLQKYEQNRNESCMEVDKQKNIAKEKREPTVADLFKIIKLQNEQLQLLQEKVDKFISANNNKCVNPPIQNFMTEQVAFESVDSEQHKISIGVMTSFEMVRTSTVINKEIVTQTNENSQIHCNKSQISIKEVVSKAQPVNLNFLDGIMRVEKPASTLQTENYSEVIEHKRDILNEIRPQSDNINDDKTFNELSLCNVQVDNSTTPLISPEQSLYLDVRDYSDSESGSDDQSNVGWTYYNKVMTHVNGMLQDSDMPSSASALYRNTRQQCVQMQIDKTNFSVTKRVKFGDDPLGVQQPHIYAASTDTSLKMNQLAAKYLKGRDPLPSCIVRTPKSTLMPMEMSFATKNYMERHRILQGGPSVPTQSPPAGEMPRFLDITALKQQPKLL